MSDPDELQTLLEKLKDSNPRVVCRAVRKLAAQPSPEVAREFCRLTRHANEYVRNTAHEALFAIRDVEALCEALAFATWNDAADLRARLIEQLSELGDRRALPMLRKCLDWSWLLFRPTRGGMQSYRNEKEAVAAAIEKIESASPVVVELPGGMLRAVSSPAQSGRGSSGTPPGGPQARAEGPGPPSGGPPGGGERPSTGDGESGEPEGVKPRVVLYGISSRAWEHPADRAALNGLRKIPVFDDVLRALYGTFGERAIRLFFLANAVRASDNQFARVYQLHKKVSRTLDAPDLYDLYITQTPFANAGALGMEKPFILLYSGTLRLLDDEELSYVIGHELGHIMSGHVLYRTMMVILLILALQQFPIVGLAARAVLTGLLEWYRKSEISSDRAGLLAVQDPMVVYRAMLKMAGGGNADELNVAEFLQQADEYRERGGVMDTLYKLLNQQWYTHPFHVLRVAELRDWVETGAYDRILKGDYPWRGDKEGPYADDVAAAARGYAEGARETMRKIGGE